MVKPKRITIADIAQKSGYSKTAVSFAFNCPERISKEAVDRILSIAREMDYIPDPMARNFSLGRYLSIGFLVPQAFSVSLDNPHSIDVLKGLGSVAESYDYTVTMIPPHHASIAEAIKSATVDGIIAFGLEFSSEIQEAQKRRKLPFVCIDGFGQDDIISISIDNVHAAKTQMTEVLKRGHRDIAVITLADAAYIQDTSEDFAPGVAEDRIKGYLEAYKEFGIEPKFHHERSEATVEGGKEAAKKILDSSHPTCIVCMSDVQAVGVIEACREQGLSIPDDISVIGFDGIDKKGINGQILTTIEQNGEEKGRVAAEVLFSLIRGEDVKERKHLVPFRFLDGQTLQETK